MQINPKAFTACFRMALPESFFAARRQGSISRQGYLAKHRRKSWLLAISFFLAAALVSLIASGQVSPPNIPAINLATGPLFAAANGDKPAITFALSVETPTVGAQYLADPQATTDDTYTNTKEYLGYYDAESCYTYNNTPAETPTTGQSATDYKRFDRSGSATGRMCSNAFSGNFLNWASSSAMDMMRLSLTGGDRYIDTPSLTILQRAVLPNGGDAGCMWNTNFFPAKKLQKDGGSANNYWGALPAVMKTQAAGNDVWVANTLNRLYFGTQKTGNCADAGAHTLGTATPSGSLGPIGHVSGDRPDDTESCAPQGGTCTFSGTKEIWYGAPGGWKVAPAANMAACDHNVLGDPIYGVNKACYYRPYDGPWVPTPNSAILSTDGFFYGRVQVCDSSSAGVLQDNRDYGLCTQYPNGNYKPVGAIQKYGEQMRLAAFGYLMDNSLGRVGGVLRAPMKYVGAKTFNTNGIDNTATGGNPHAEWNANTGVFLSNPDNDTTQTTPISGVINYVNKFGRTGPVLGRYKGYDPVGELHYEALRYLQGLQPTQGAVAAATSDMSDGFPVFTTWTDPYGDGRSASADYSCLKSNIVTIGDIETWDQNRLPASPNAANNIVDINYWRSVVQAFEKNESKTYGVHPVTGNPLVTGNPNGANGAVASSTDRSQMLGTSYWANTHDIRGTTWTNAEAMQRPGLRVKSLFFDVDAYRRASNEADRRYKNQFFTAAKYGGFETDASNIGGKPYNTYGNPFQRQDGTIDNNVWQDPATPGEASAYYRQSDGRSVLRAFDNIFSRVASSARSIAGSATSSKNVTQAGSTIYQAAFDTSDWNGDVLSLPLNVDSSHAASVGKQPNWSAADKLSTRVAPATSRNIVVGNVGSTANPVASSFTWDAIDNTLKAHLAKITPASDADTLAPDRLNYLRGDRSKEAGIFRKRTKLLGDIVNSGIVYSGAPAGNVGPSSTYPGFVTANASRAAAIFVGANDGMLHAFNASTGDELFGYIPSWMGRKLAALTSPNYNNKHQSYVDATPTVAEAQVGSAQESIDWKTVLVSGTGAGGAGVFALDVTNPSTFSASNVMWEFTHADDADLGYVVGRPKIVKLRTSAPNAKTPAYRWFAMVASGVNNYVPDSTFGGTYSDTGRPALFLLALDKPAGEAWTALGTEGTPPNYYKISLPIDMLASATKATGLINFQPVFGTAAEVTQVYMGDLHGNLWKLDFSLHGATEWNMNKLSAYKKGPVADPQPYPLYIAKTSEIAPVRQPISMAPSIVAGPLVGGVRTTYIAFATGKYLETSDNATTGSNSLYVIYDNGSIAADSSPATASVISGRGRLQSGSINTTTGAVTVPAFTWGRAASDLDGTQRSGWMIDFTGAGERVVNNATVAGDNLIFGSLIPAATTATGPCPKAGGGKAYVINIDSGQGNTTNSTVGLLGEPLVLEITSAATYTNSTTTGRRVKTVVREVVQQGSSGVTTGGTVTNTLATGRLSWRQINNYQEQKNAS